MVRNFTTAHFLQVLQSIISSRHYWSSTGQKSGMKGCPSFLPSPQPPASSLSSAPTPSSLHLLRAFLWNMAGRKKSTIGVLSSDRQPCCAFSSRCEQALGRQPHKTWRNLTCVQNSSSCRSLKQTRTHAVPIACRHTSHVQKNFSPGYQTHAWRKWTPGDHFIDILNALLGFVILLHVKEGGGAVTFAASLPARRINEPL